MQLTPEQENAISNTLRDIKNKKKIVKIGGFAGTGKTTLILELRDKLPGEWAVCAYTGKAANVLRKKGLSDSSTIHSLIYVPKKDSSGNIALDQHGSPIFILNPNLDCYGILVDEASMVGKDIYQDLLSFNKPVIFIGDHGQLEPVGSGEVNVMQTPDYRLEKIHRNAGEIAKFAEFVRMGYRPEAFAARSTGTVRFINKQQAAQELLNYDQIICGYNKVRVEVNLRIRAAHGQTDNWPVVGDRVMCLRNNSEKGLFNGMQGTVDYLYPKQKNRMIFTSDNKSYDIFFDPTQFNKPRYDFSGHRSDPNPFDFCYAITCHKAQGDEFDRVMVFEQRSGMWDFKRWAYTAASRAKILLTWVI